MTAQVRRYDDRPIEQRQRLVAAATGVVVEDEGTRGQRCIRRELGGRRELQHLGAGRIAATFIVGAGLGSNGDRVAVLDDIAPDVGQSALIVPAGHAAEADREEILGGAMQGVRKLHQIVRLSVLPVRVGRIGIRWVDRLIVDPLPAASGLRRDRDAGKLKSADPQLGTAERWMRAGENLLAQLLQKSIFFRRADGREVAAHALVAELPGRYFRGFPADLVGDDDLIVVAVEQHSRRRWRRGWFAPAGMVVSASAVADDSHEHCDSPV